MIERHGNRFWAPRIRFLDELRSELEDRTSERSLVAQAKALLQNRNGLSEQQAYIEMRAASRRTRSAWLKWYTDQPGSPNHHNLHTHNNLLSSLPFGFLVCPFGHRKELRRQRPLNLYLTIPFYCS